MFGYAASSPTSTSREASQAQVRNFHELLRLRHRLRDSILWDSTPRRVPRVGAQDGHLPQATSSPFRRSSEVRHKKLPRLRVDMVASHTFEELRDELVQDEEINAARVCAFHIHGTSSTPLGEHHTRIKAPRRVLHGDEESLATSWSCRPHLDEVPLHDGIEQRHCQDYLHQHLQVSR